MVNTVLKRSFFQDVPFLWRRNPDHPFFTLPFFEKYEAEWGKWSLVLLNFHYYMDQVGITKGRRISRGMMLALGTEVYKD